MGVVKQQRAFEPVLPQQLIAVKHVDERGGGHALAPEAVVPGLCHALFKRLYSRLRFAAIVAVGLAVQKPKVDQPLLQRCYRRAGAARQQCTQGLLAGGVAQAGQRGGVGNAVFCYIISGIDQRFLRLHHGGAGLGAVMAVGLAAQQPKGNQPLLQRGHAAAMRAVGVALLRLCAYWQHHQQDHDGDQPSFHLWSCSFPSGLHNLL